MHSIFPKIGLLLGLTWLIGCDSGVNRYPVTGTINFQGKPLDQGTIEFHPEDKEGKTFGGALIADGKFVIPADKGLAPGKYKVRISSPDPKQKVDTAAAPGESGPPAKNRIPVEFNQDSKIIFEVQASQSNVFNKDIP